MSYRIRQPQIGETYGRLTVLGKGTPAPSVKTNRDRFLECKCTCGTICVVNLYALANGHTQSCGCLHKEEVAKIKWDHGLASKKASKREKRLYDVWHNIISRCSNLMNPNYGGRGIAVCKEWSDNPRAFIAWVESLPDNETWWEGLEPDRIDNNGDYEPGNIHFVDKITNANNRSDNVFHEIGGETFTTAELCRVYDCDRATFERYRKKGEHINNAIRAAQAALDRRRARSLLRRGSI